MSTTADPDTWVTFVWHGARHALAAAAVTAIVDHPAIGPLPLPLGAITQVLAHGGELCPLLTAPEAAPDAPVVVCVAAAGNVALRVGEPIQIERGTPQSDGVLCAGQRLPILSPAQLTAAAQGGTAT